MSMSLRQARGIVGRMETVLRTLGNAPRRSKMAKEVGRQQLEKADALLMLLDHTEGKAAPPQEPDDEDKDRAVCEPCGGQGKNHLQEDCFWCEGRGYRL